MSGGEVRSPAEPALRARPGDDAAATATPATSTAFSVLDRVAPNLGDHAWKYTQGVLVLGVLVPTAMFAAEAAEGARHGRQLEDFADAEVVGFARVVYLGIVAAFTLRLILLAVSFFNTHESILRRCVRRRARAWRASVLRAPRPRAGSRSSSRLGGPQSVGSGRHRRMGVLRPRAACC